MARSLAVKLDVDLAPAGAEPALAPAPRRGRRGHENARALQQRLLEAYAPASGEIERELSPFVRLAAIVGASSVLWGMIGLGVGALL